MSHNWWDYLKVLETCQKTNVQIHLLLVDDKIDLNSRERWCVSPIPFVRLQLELSRENISDIPSKMIEENGTEDQEEECQRTY